MAGAYKLDEKGARLIFDDEQYVPIAYPDSAGNWTIGVGHLITASEQHLRNTVLTREQAFTLFKQDLREREAHVNQYITRKKTQNEFNALVSFIYNVGIGNFRNSGLAKLVQDNKNSEAIRNKWLSFNRDSNGNFQTGLDKRRKREYQLYTKRNNAAYAWASENTIPLAVAAGIIVLAALWWRRKIKSKSNQKK